MGAGASAEGKGGVSEPVAGVEESKSSGSPAKGGGANARRLEANSKAMWLHMTEHAVRHGGAVVEQKDSEVYRTSRPMPPSSPTPASQRRCT